MGSFDIIKFFYVWYLHVANTALILPLGFAFGASTQSVGTYFNKKSNSNLHCCLHLALTQPYIYRGRYFMQKDAIVSGKLIGCNLESFGVYDKFKQFYST